DDWDWLYRADLLTLKEQFWLVPRYPYNDRPIGALVIRVMYRIFGLNPVPFHVMCLGLHLINMTLLLAVARRILASWWVSTAAALAFGIWSAAIGGVTWIADIFDVLGATLVLLTTFTFLSKRAAVRASSVFFYILAARTKEATLGLPFVLLVWVLCGTWLRRVLASEPQSEPRPSGSVGRAKRSPLIDVLPHLLVALFLTIVYIPIIIQHQKNPDVTYRMEISPKTFVDGLFYYFSRLMYGGPWPIGRLIRWTIAIGALAAGVAWRPRAALFGLAGFVIYLGPVIFMARQRDAIYLYMPTAFLSLALGAAAEAVAARWRLRELPVAGAMAAFCLLALPHQAHMRSKAEWMLSNTAQAGRDLTSFRSQVPALKSGAHVRLEGFAEGYNVFRTPGCSVLKVAYHVDPVHCEFSNEGTPADVVVVRRGDGIVVSLK
ncbi:MAG: hypothetical protein ABI806_20275, partial [Candidatus Solibacter sp.]